MIHCGRARIGVLFILTLLPLLSGCVSRSVTEVPTISAIGMEDDVVLTDFSSDSRHLALLTQGNELQLWNVADGKRVASVTLPEGRPRQLELCADSMFATIVEDRVVVWDTTGQQVLTIEDEGAGIEFVRGDVGSSQLAVGHSDGSVSIWSLRRKQKLSELEPPVGVEVRFVALTDYGVVYQTAANVIVLRSLRPGATDREAQVSGDPSVEMAFSRDGNTVATVNYEGAVEVWDLTSGQVVSTLEDFDRDPETLALSPDGSVLAVNGAGGVELWDVSARELLDQFETTVWVQQGIAFAPDGMFLSWVEANKTEVRFWSPVTGVVRWRAGEAELLEAAREVCTNLALTIRYRQAMTPVATGREHLAAERLSEAKEAFELAYAILPTYPGLEEVRAETERLHQILLRQRELLTLAATQQENAEFEASCETLERFIREFPEYPDTSIPTRAQALRTMLAHLAVAEEHRKARREVEAILEFEKAVAVVPEIEERHPEYGRLRTSLVSRLEREASNAFEETDHARVIAAYGQLVRLEPLTESDWFRAGVAFENLGRFDRAFEAYDKVSQSSGEYADARWGLSRLARLRGDGATAKVELERAREAAPRRQDLETEYAEVCKLVNDIDGAVAAWKRLGSWNPSDPAPFREIARLEGHRDGWQAAGEAFEEAFRRAEPPQRDLLREAASAYDRAGREELALELFLETLAALDGDGDHSWLGERPRIAVLNWIREVGFVRHDGEWLAHAEFMQGQGWLQHDGTWIRPEEAQLRAVAQQFQGTPSTEHRSGTDQEYRESTRARTIAQGMNRREVIRAWGYFRDMNRTKATNGVTFEQLLYEDGRQVFLSDGVVCSWTE